MEAIGTAPLELKSVQVGPVEVKDVAGTAAELVQSAVDLTLKAFAADGWQPQHATDFQSLAREGHVQIEPLYDTTSGRWLNTRKRVGTQIGVTLQLQRGNVGTL